MPDGKTVERAGESEDLSENKYHPPWTRGSGRQRSLRKNQGSSDRDIFILSIGPGIFFVSGLIIIGSF